MITKKSIPDLFLCTTETTNKITSKILRTNFKEMKIKDYRKRITQRISIHFTLSWKTNRNTLRHIESRTSSLYNYYFSWNLKPSISKLSGGGQKSIHFTSIIWEILNLTSVLLCFYFKYLGLSVSYLQGRWVLWICLFVWIRLNSLPQIRYHGT